MNSDTSAHADEDGTTQRLPTLDKQAPGSQDAPSGAPAESEGPTRRFWSLRRVAALLLSALLLAGLALLLYDVVSVRLDRPGMTWRRALADELATRQLRDVWIRVGAIAAAVLGLWLLIHAFTPGMRRLLPMRPQDPHTRAALERSAVGLVLRDRAMAVPGVQSARVKVKRRKAKVRAVTHFRDLQDVRADLNAALQSGIDSLGLAHPLGVSLRVGRPNRRPSKK
ncbi:DUF6286 domain-containing protein [Streptomyces sp. NPDC058534]|uniref:DUF6286 domain-containing protein n=1 Tax=Streptomyces sp. NPDC058534 TaxID=3346541 RepID=UPI003653E432